MAVDTLHPLKEAVTADPRLTAALPRPGSRAATILSAVEAGATVAAKTAAARAAVTTAVRAAATAGLQGASCGCVRRELLC